MRLLERALNRLGKKACAMNDRQNRCPLRVEAVDDAIRAGDHLAQVTPLELGDDPPGFWERFPPVYHDE